MATSAHKSPSVGTIVKKVIAINPDLSALDIIEIIKRSTDVQGDTAGEFASVEVIDELKALSMAQATLR